MFQPCRMLGLPSWCVASVELSGGGSLGGGGVCIIRPVASCGVDPVDRGSDGDAEHLGEDHGGDVCGEVLSCCSSGGACVDAEVAESLSEAESGDRPAGQVAWEQPATREGRADPDVVGAAGGDEGADVCGERLGNGDGLGAE